MITSTRKKKLPYFIRFIRYSLNCIFNLLFPVGIEQDDFSKQFKDK
jgi:hypothetical protein